MTTKLEELVGSRTRFQRITDASVNYGWLTRVEELSLTVTSDSEDCLEQGERFLFEVVGGGCRALFHAKLREFGGIGEPLATEEAEPTEGEGQPVVKVANAELRFSIESQVLFTKSDESPRRLADGMRLTLQDGDQEIEADVIDMSVGGIGIATDKPLHRGAIVMLRLDSPSGEIEGAGEVRYCKQAKGGERGYRIGLKFTELGRLDRPKWTRFFEAA